MLYVLVFSKLFYVELIVCSTFWRVFGQDGVSKPREGLTVEKNIQRFTSSTYSTFNTVWFVPAPDPFGCHFLIATLMRAV